MFTVFDVGNDRIYINWIKLRGSIFGQSLASEQGNGAKKTLFSPSPGVSYFGLTDCEYFKDES